MDHELEMNRSVVEKDVDLELAQGVGDDEESNSTLPPPIHSPQSSCSTSSFNDEMALSFRPLKPSDRQEIQALHEEWFPVSYEDEFYNELVKNRMFNSGEKLFSCVATHQKQEVIQSPPPRLTTKDGVIFHIESFNAEDVVCREIKTSDKDDTIVACIVGSFLNASRINKHTREILLGNSTSSPQQRHTKLFYIMTLGTVTEFRHLGLATVLVERCIELVEQDPACGALYLHVITFNEAAIRFYEKLGFYRVEEVQDYYTINGKHYNCYLYAKYFHGNRGHRTIFNFVSRIFSVVWDRVFSPASLFQEVVGGYDEGEVRG